MGLPNFLLILIILPTMLSASPDHQPMLLKLCNDIENKESCLTNIQQELMNTQLKDPDEHQRRNSILSAALKNSLNEARAAIEMITRFNSLSINYREQVAIEDCKELLDFSVSELAWSLGEMRIIRSGSNDAHHEGNLKAWLSAAFSNQDTCLEGFEGTDRRVERFISGSLKQNLSSSPSDMGRHNLPFLDLVPQGIDDSVSGKGFIARDMTFRNTAGPENHQAVALRVDSDQSAFFRCSMEGHQDKLYAHSLRQFYRECDIYGTIDFIFGNGAAVLQNCKIYTRVPLPLQKVTIAAQGRKNPHQSTGSPSQYSYVLATQPTYLGRPWKQYSRTVYMNTYMSGLVQPRGWLEWYGDFALGTLWYGEYRNYGPGAHLSGRVKWPGFHVIRDAATANFFTVGRFIDGMSWLPSTGIKFIRGLTN
ncbi:putative pectinesterase/pectinesterase inhibitor 22 [Morus notabilis]|uniref:putative pectinesterase/pectinesterase inhibitor 22 n=1 Tax=Morus notabilis TaxID=981085 RepID=UPI000CED760D|nr:putative pectinesterase/pectinesterase inhibitor 22 [Morus notabilis]